MKNDFLVRWTSCLEDLVVVRVVEVLPNAEKVRRHLKPLQMPASHPEVMELRKNLTVQPEMFHVDLIDA